MRLHQCIINVNNKRMGYNCYFHIIGTLGLRDLLINNKNSELGKHDDLWHNQIPEAENISDKSTFFDNIDVELIDFELNIIHWSDFFDDNNDKVDFHIVNYLNLMMYDLLLEAIAENDPKFRNYCKIFDDIEDLGIDDGCNAMIILCYKTSYKGSEPVNIKVGREISNGQNRYISGDRLKKNYIVTI